MRFFDSSAIVPLLIDEPKTRAMQQLIAADAEMAVWWAAAVECVSAITRRDRSGLVSEAARTVGRARLQALAPSWREVEPSAAIRETAVRLLQTHDLRAADALQLAAAFAASEGRPPSLIFVALDSRLNEAAQREGFRLVESEH